MAKWMAEVTGSRAHVVNSPGEQPEADGPRLFLCGFGPYRSAKTRDRRQPLIVVAQYLVWSHREDARTAHQEIWNLLVAAVERAHQGDWEVDLQGLDAPFWRSLGVPRRPAILLKVKVRHDWEQPVVPIVTEPPVLVAGPSRPLLGALFGPGDVAIEGARVELPSLRSRATTSKNGRFRFDAVPTGDHAPTMLRVHAKGTVTDIAIDGRSATPLVVHLPLSLPEVN